jgi:exosortase/archaeosortase family protein
MDHDSSQIVIRISGKRRTKDQLRISMSPLKNKAFHCGIIFIAVLITGSFLINITGGRDSWEQQIMSGIATLSAITLNNLGVYVHADGNTLDGQDFRIHIGPACIAFYEIIVFAAAIAACPMRVRHKIGGVLFGIAAIFLANLFRVIGLYLSGRYFPKFFDILHDHVAQAIFILVMAILWVMWVTKYGKRVTAE